MHTDTFKTLVGTIISCPQTSFTYKTRLRTTTAQHAHPAGRAQHHRTDSASVSQPPHQPLDQTPGPPLTDRPITDRPSHHTCHVGSTGRRPTSGQGRCDQATNKSLESGSTGMARQAKIARPVIPPAAALADPLADCQSLAIEFTASTPQRRWGEADGAGREGALREGLWDDALSPVNRRSPRPSHPGTPAAGAPI